MNTKHDRVQMVFKKFFVLELWTKVALGESALDGTKLISRATLREGDQFMRSQPF